MKRILSLLTGILLLCVSTTVARPQRSRGTNTPNATSIAENLNLLLEPIRQKYDLPALAGAIVTSKGLFAAGAVGVRKYGSDTPVTVDDQFHLGSETKAMTATMLATLVEEGKLSWNTTLEQVFPDLVPKMNPAYRKVTLEQLLSHRTGFTDESWPREALYGGSYYDTQRMDNLLMTQCLLASHMNGRPLPPVYGAPLRLRVENQLGYKMVKWIERIEFIQSEKQLGKGEGGKNEDDEYFDLLPNI